VLFSLKQEASASIGGGTFTYQKLRCDKMDIDRICCRCNKPLLTGYYYFNNKFGICIDCITKLSVLEIRNENQLHIKEVEAALKKGNC
jgi:hypothetical protein